jgi:hypothetical protein
MDKGNKKQERIDHALVLHSAAIAHCPVCGDLLPEGRTANNRRRLILKAERERQTTPIVPKDYTLPCQKSVCVTAYFQVPKEKVRTSLAEGGKRYVMGMLAGAGVRCNSTVDNDPDGDIHVFDFKRYVEVKTFTQGDPELPKQRGIPAVRVFRNTKTGEYSAAAYTGAEVLVEQRADFEEGLARIDSGTNPGEDPNNPRWGWKSVRVRASGVQQRAEARWKRICANDELALTEWLA